LLFANFAEAIAEGPQQGAGRLAQGRAQGHDREKLAKPSATRALGAHAVVQPAQGRHRYVDRAISCPGDGEVIEGAASINESAITGESAPVIRAAGSDFTRSPAAPSCSPTGSSCASRQPGRSVPRPDDRMVEARSGQKTPNEIALTILLVAMTLVFLLATVTLLPFSIYSVEIAKAGTPVTITVLVALLVCLIPTTIGGLLSAIGSPAWAG
jgi:K+-transporting ATPase ATPase B chain